MSLDKQRYKEIDRRIEMKKCSDCIFITYRGYCTCNDMEALVGKVCTDYREQSEYDGPSLDNKDDDSKEGLWD